MHRTLLVGIGLIGAVSLPPFAAANEISFSEPDMVEIPSGEFLMGGTAAREQPQHKVVIETFRMSKYETTVDEFSQFVKATGHKTKNNCWIWQEKTQDHNWGINRKEGNWKTDKYAPTGKHPVMCVTWEDANAYAAWLSDITGKFYRLPTEAEWEYAAKAGTNTTYYFGDDVTKLCEYGNVRDQTGAKAMARDYKVYLDGIPCDDGSEYTSQVGKYVPNGFGLYDMIGNVGEFVADCEHPDYRGAPQDGSAWMDGCNSENPMVIERGGAYGAGAVGTSSAYRGHAGPDNASSLGEGFRLAETIIPIEK